MLFSSAFAQTAAGGGSDFQAQLTQFLPLILIAGVFYFLLIRPQQQKVKQLKAQQSALRRGDRVITAGGIIATVARVINDEELELEIAAGVKVRVVRSTISTILAKPEPAGKDGGKEKSAKTDAKAEAKDKNKDIATREIEGAEQIDATAEANAETDAEGAAKRRPSTKSAGTAK
jgi:preprotein translocase subunit YajC